MNDVTAKGVLPSLLNILIWVVSLTIAAFYILSSAGWLLATYLVLHGTLDGGGRAFFQTLSLVDHGLRVIQVLLVCLASVLLVARRGLAVKIFAACLVLSLLSTVYLVPWRITYLGGVFPCALLAISTGYAFWLGRRGVLK